MEEADRLLGPEVGDADGNNEPRNFHPSSRVKYRPLASSPMRRTRPSSCRALRGRCLARPRAGLVRLLQRGKAASGCPERLL